MCVCPLSLQGVCQFYSSVFLFIRSVIVCVFIVCIQYTAFITINLLFILLKLIKVSLDTKCKVSVPTSTVHQAVDERKLRAVVHGGVSCLRHGRLLLTDPNKGNL